MKTLLVFYSRTGATKKIAEYISRKINCEVEEMKSEVNRSGILGYLRCGREAMKKSTPPIITSVKNPAEYDLIILGSPVWVGTISSPVRTYLTQNKNKFQKLAFFCTAGSLKNEKVLKEVENFYGQKLVTATIIQKREVAHATFEPKVDEFLKETTK